MASASSPTAKGATFLVNTTSDTTDGTCNATHCSLREAIAAANALGGPDTVAFDIGGGGIQTITVATSLPVITGPLTIDGTTQPGFAGTPLIEIRGPGPTSGTGLEATNTLHARALSMTNHNLGVLLRTSSAGSTLRGNWIGFRPDSSVAPNNIGVDVDSASTIGGTTAGDRNVIGGNASNVGVGSVVGVMIQGNYIGITPDGLAAASSSQSSGIATSSSSGGMIGGDTPAARNVISGHTTPTTGVGVYFGDRFGTPSGWTVAGNYIGLNAAGTAAIPNNHGVELEPDVTDITIGGNTTASRNVISGNLRTGITSYSATGTVIVNNYIGVGPDGVQPMGNGSSTAADAGIRIPDGELEIYSNTIAYSAGDGVIVTGATTSAEIRANNIHSNDLLGIDLSDNGVTANDVGDGDTGPNTLQNFPTVTSAATSPSGTAVTLNIQTGGPIGAALFTVYASDACDASGFGEGALLVGAALAVLSGPSVNVNVNLTTPVTSGQSLTAQVSFLGSSELGPCFTVPACASPSTDCDSYNDTPVTNHTGPANNTITLDNCSAVWNQLQRNTIGNFVDNSPPYSLGADDKTMADSDAQGDDCDADDDNDGLDDNVEAGLPFAPCPTASGPTNPLLRDTDGDRVIDGAECTLGFDPASASSKPTLTQCGPAGDADGDKISDRIEICYYSTNPAATDSDGDRLLDGGRDGCEIASLNGDRIVSSGDQGMLASGISGATVYHVNIDINKDGLLNSGDQGLMASFISPPGQCPG
jgi:CSLREA domain-containing protein